MSTTRRGLSERLVEEIKGLLPRYPTRRAALLPALHLVQEELGRVPHEAVVGLAELLGLKPAEVEDTLTFYGFFRQDEPLGRVRVWVCRSLSCSCRGGEELLEYLGQKLGIRPGQTTPDGRVTLEVAECLGACDYAPAMLADGTLHKNLTKGKIDAFVESIRQDASSGGLPGA